MRLLTGALTIVAVAAFGCGDQDAGSGGTAAPEPPARSAGQEAADCGRVDVPGHEAVGIRAAGVSCEGAKAVAAAAQGRGRQPYQVNGFGCEPAETGGGDTNYTCTRGDARIRFRYGTA